MELRQLNSFVQVAQFGSFSKAAEALGYSQSAVTIQIRLLEEELGVRLFDRVGRRIMLTKPGKRFLGSACAVLQELEKAAESLIEREELTGELSIGAIDSLCTAMLPGVLRRFYALHPKVSVRVVTESPEQLIRKMERGEVDLVYILDKSRHSDAWCKAMEAPEEVVFAASAALPVREDEAYTVKDLLAYPFYLTERDANYRRVFDRYLESQALTLRPALEIGDISFIKRMLELHPAISLLPRFMVQADVDAGRLKLLNVTDFRAGMYRQILYPKSYWKTVEMDEFIRLVTEAEREK